MTAGNVAMSVQVLAQPGERGWAALAAACGVPAATGALLERAGVCAPALPAVRATASSSNAAGTITVNAKMRLLITGSCPFLSVMRRLSARAVARPTAG